MPQGTGFFAGVPREPEGEEVLGSFVTAKHVLQRPDGKFFETIYLRLDRKAGDASFVKVPINPALVLVHPDPTVDLAVLGFLPPEGEYEFKTISTDTFASSERLAKLPVAEGSDVFFTGLLATYYGASRNTPVVRFGRVAMYPHQPVPWKERPSDPVTKPLLYLLETQSFGGNSGSPVFFSFGADSYPGQLRVGGSKIVLAGVMRGTFEGSRILELVPTANIPVYRQNLGIAAVTPAFQLLELFNQERLKKAREEYWRAHPPLKKGSAPSQQ